MPYDIKGLEEQLLVGAYDLHTHSSPSPFPRAQDGMELIREADRAQMAGIMLKSHYDSTAARAALINLYSGVSTRAFGGLVLNWPVGGLNPYAVENALEMGAKIIWMPTRDAQNSLCFGNMSGDFFQRPGISILDENGSLKSSVYDVMDIIVQRGAVLATGHISPQESLVLCREGRKRGVRMILTHPEFPRTFIPTQTQNEIADLGVIIEKNWFNVAQGRVTIQEMVNTIRLIGSDRCFIATDRGQKGFPSPVSELKRFIAELLQAGLTPLELKNLVQTVPKSIVMD